jgi:hypothetical protein
LRNRTTGSRTRVAGEGAVCVVGSRYVRNASIPTLPFSIPLGHAPFGTSVQYFSHARKIRRERFLSVLEGVALAAFREHDAVLATG